MIIALLGMIMCSSLMLAGELFHQHPLLALGIAAVDIMLLGAMVSYLQRAARFTLVDVLVDDGATINDTKRYQLDLATPLYVQTQEGRIRPVKSMFTAHFDGQTVLVLEERWVSADSI